MNINRNHSLYFSKKYSIKSRKRYSKRIAKTISGIFLALYFAIFSTSSHSDDETNYSITISGGISLGVYEAGLNWAIVELLKDEYLRSSKEAFALTSVAGASAGSINALISAIRFCERKGLRDHHDVVDNPYYDIWDIDLKEMLPRNVNYQGVTVGLNPDREELLSDAIFTRSPFGERLNALKSSLSDNDFEPGCSVDIGMIVSRSLPKHVNIPIEPFSQTVPVQRFVIPVNVGVEENPRTGATRLVFRNQKRYADKKDEILSRYLFLPEQDGEIPFDIVIRAALASSAFPGAFGRVNLQYCTPNIGIAERAQFVAGRCPDNHHIETGYFVDGGVFDNVPVGVAVQLSELLDEEKRDATNFIYLDPNSVTEKLKTRSEFNSDLGFNDIASQIRLFSSTLSTLREQQLSLDLVNHFGSVDNRKLLVTKRSKPLVGSYLNGFAAFIDRSFFQHDYAAGVFDGLMNVSRYLCEIRPELSISIDACTGGIFGAFEILSVRLLSEPNPYSETIEDLNCKEPRSTCDEYKLIRELIMRFKLEEMNSFPDNSYCTEHDQSNPISSNGREQLLSVANTICQGGIKNFEELVRILDSKRRNKMAFRGDRWRYGETFEYVARNSDGRWIWGLAEHALSRMYRMERSGSGGQEGLIAAVWASLPEVEQYSVDRHISTTRKVLGHAIPRTVGVDGAQGGIFASWEPLRLGLPSGDCIKLLSKQFERVCQRVSFTVGWEGHFRRVVNEQGYFNTISAHSGIRYQRAGRFVFSSFGARYKWNQDIESDYLSTFDSKYKGPSYNSIEIYMRFFGDKISFSLGFPEGVDSIGDKNLSVRIGLSGIEKFFTTP